MVLALVFPHHSDLDINALLSLFAAEILLFLECT